jgi:glycosyltransferase involved in cell wall biosynthesis
VVVSSTQRRGAEIEGAAVAAGLASIGWQAEALALVPGSGDSTLELDHLGPSPRSRTTLAALRRRARSTDVVIAYGGTTLPAAAIALTGLRTPWIYRSIGDPAAWVRGSLHRRRTSMLLRRADHVVGLWPGAAMTLLGLYGIDPDRISTIPNVRDPERFRPPTSAERAAARDALGIRGGEPVVVMLGALSAEKQPLLAIEAVMSVPHTRLVIAGDGPLREATAQAAAATGGRVRLLGAVADPLGVLHAADTLILSSQTEGMPGAAIEAAMCGLPVAASRVGAMAHVVIDGATGHLADTDPSTGLTTPAGLAEALTRCLVARPTIGAAARDHAVERYSIDNVVAQWAELLTTVVNSSAR